MVGGKVKEVIDCGNLVWVNCEENCYRISGCKDPTCTHEECAVYVERNENSLKIKAGDKLWWQGQSTYWTPQPFTKNEEDLKCGIDYEIDIRKMSGSGVSRPELVSC